MKLSDFKDEKAVEVVANLLPHITNIALNSDNEKAKGESIAEFARTILLNNAADVKAIFAILNDIDPADYHCTAASVLVDTFSMFSDPDMRALFGLQSQMPTSSASASTTTEVEA